MADVDRLASMAVFANVVDAKSFSDAARQLGLSKSAVSKHVSRLEDRLGVRLLNRTTRRLSMTEAGAAFYEHAARILAEAEEAETAVTRLSNEPRGLLRVNAPVSFAMLHLATAIPEFLARFPEVEIDMTLDDRFVDLVEEGYDLAIRVGNMADSGLVTRRLAVSNHVLCASADYLRRRGTPQTPEALADHDCLAYTRLVTSSWQLIGPAGRVDVRPRGRMRSNNGDLLRAAALGGLGVMFSPTFIVGEDIKAGRLQVVLDGYRPPPTAVHAVYPHRRHLTPKVRAFIDFLADRFGPIPYWDEGIGCDFA